MCEEYLHVNSESLRLNNSVKLNSCKSILLCKFKIFQTPATLSSYNEAILPLHLDICSFRSARRRWMRSSLLLWSNPNPFWRGFILYKANRGTLSFYPFMWAQESHTQPPIERRKQMDALLVLNKGDGSQSSTHCRWNWGLILDSGRDPCDWGSDLKSLNSSYMFEAQQVKEAG